ncbi:hypothetical protein C9J03_07575 [Photobacterium gaetbulicola]|uniref:Uncharacterized protein n=1 Tax=Photobacterium gaetbulicola Gung47 TaxID=658445 RepID=A0A0C5WSA4_9GAMM|nr:MULTISPECIES: DUF5718 family protein [Photobacterium]AJR05870.1 hypothetical protein H744_1c0845 [Photobacterium gaetbulicola Gung47]PSU13313.1 hypothetical protein C9J03_07575 [Photobacterium gaetbulicola]WEM45734.1 DUF5718 family protein [Photobacterium sp. DA100]
MTYKHVIGFGVAGNFAGHLEQAGEDKDFLAVEVKEAVQPKAIFPFYVPSDKAGFLSTYPLSSEVIIPPNDADNLQIEPEVALICDIEYQENRVVALKPHAFAAYNDCSIRKPNAKKISEKKNWGPSTKGISSQVIAVEHLSEGGKLDNFRIASFHKRGETISRYGEDSPVVGYSYFHEKLLNWIVDRMNHQQDVGPTENIADFLADAEYPSQAVISIGATRYTEFGETTFLKSGDISMVVVYDGTAYSPEAITAMAEKQSFEGQGISALVQSVA